MTYVCDRIKLGKNWTDLSWMSERHWILLVITFYCNCLNLRREVLLKVCLKVINLETKKCVRVNLICELKGMVSPKDKFKTQLDSLYYYISNDLSHAMFQSSRNRRWMLTILLFVISTTDDLWINTLSNES